MGKLICVCAEASQEECETCPKGSAINPSRTFVVPSWIQDTEGYKVVAKGSSI